MSHVAYRVLHLYIPVRGFCLQTAITNEKNSQRDANTARALAVVMFGHRPPARPLSQTHRQDRLQYTAPQLASAQCNKQHSSPAAASGWIPRDITISVCGTVSTQCPFRPPLQVNHTALLPPSFHIFPTAFHYFLSVTASILSYPCRLLCREYCG